MSKFPQEKEKVAKNLLYSPRTINSQPSKPTNYIKQPQSNENKYKQLEGECRIISVSYLKVNYVKATILSILLGLSVFGLLLLKYYKSLRAMVFYDYVLGDQIDDATHVLVNGSDKNEEICDIIRKKLNQKVSMIFEFKHLNYQIQATQPVPLAYHYDNDVGRLMSEKFMKSGLSWEQAASREHYYGRNEHSVEVPGYFEYLFDVMTKPFFIFQYIVSVIYILQSVAIFGVLMIVFGWLTTTVNYILLRRSYSRIKQTAEKQFIVKVFRNGQFQQIKNTSLVPGDLYHPEKEIPCDSIILRGDLFVNEASLTGENVPISKVKLTDIQNRDQECHWIFQGSFIETVKQNTLAVAINVGFGSRRGRIIRKIVTKSTKQPQFFTKLIYFLLQVLLVAIIVYFATLKYVLSTNIEAIMVAFRFFDFITYSFPAPFPIFFNLAYSFCLTRLNQHGIIGVQAEKTVESGRLKTICFDKTGTLTENKMRLDKVYCIDSNDNIVDFYPQGQQEQITLNLFACCNSVESINGELKGDQIDLEMFLFSKAELKPTEDQQIIRSVVVQQRTIDILKINQYESKFQSMSVLVRMMVNDMSRYFIFIKGSPEMLCSFAQFYHQDYLELIKNLSLQGYRSIGFGYREIQECQLQMLMRQDRDYFLKQAKMLGLVSFINILKDDVKATIQLLSKNEVNTKIITGDNIFLGIQTAILTEMIPLNATIVILEGRKCKSSKQVVLTKLSRKEQGNFAETTQSVEEFEFVDDFGLVYAIDNDYINLNRQDFLRDKVKVFARVTPENKALIVRKHKEYYQKEANKKSWLQRVFGECNCKVAMVGDGANDLIAIKEADVGIGLAEADAVLSSSFAIKNLSQVSQIIRQAKNTQRQIIDLVQYFAVVQILCITQLLILTSDATFPTSMQLMYKNFANTLLITLFFGLSQPAKEMTKYFTNTNFMGLQNHLVFWGNTIIYSVGMLASYLYYYISSDFQPNPNPQVSFSKGYYGLTKSATIVFLASNIIYVFHGMLVYRSKPWKQPFYKNKLFTILIVVNIIAIFVMFFNSSQFSFLDVQPINRAEAGFVLLIMLFSVVVSTLYNYIMEELVLHQGKQQFKQIASDDASF